MYLCNRYIYFYRARETKCDVRNESRWQTVTAAARSRFFGERRKFTEELRGDYYSLAPLTPILALKVDTIEDTSNTRLRIFRMDFGRPVSRFILIEKLHALHTTLAYPTLICRWRYVIIRKRNWKMISRQSGGSRGQDDKPSTISTSIIVL